MLFYLALAIACVIAASVCIWLFRSMVEISKSTYRAILPSANSNRLEARREAVYAGINASLASTPSPWGWNKHNAPGHSREGRGDGAGEQEPWGWPGNSGLKRSNLGLIGSGLERSAAAASMKDALLGNKKASKGVGWPYREERSEVKARRRKKASAGRIGPARDSKPWGW